VAAILQEAGRESEYPFVVKMFVEIGIVFDEGSICTGWSINFKSFLLLGHCFFSNNSFANCIDKVLCEEMFVQNFALMVVEK